MSNIGNFILPLLLASQSGLSVGTGSKSTSSTTSQLLSQLLQPQSTSSIGSLLSLGGLSSLTSTAPTSASLLGKYPSVGNNQSQLVVFILLLLLLKEAQQTTSPPPPTPQPPSFYQGNTIPSQDVKDLISAINKPDPNKPELDVNGISLAQLDKFIADPKNKVDTKLGKAARVLRASFSLIAFQTGSISKISNSDVDKFFNLDLKKADLSSIDQAGDRITAQEEQKILKYITDNQDKLNAFGDDKSVKYTAGATPTFSGSGESREVRLGANGDKGIQLSLPSYFIARHRNWRDLIKNVKLS